MIGPINAVRAQVGESAVWCDRSERLFTVDVFGKSLIRQDLEGNFEAFAMPELAACVVLGACGVVVGLETQLLAGDPGGNWQRIKAPEDHPATHRFNDATVDARGRIVIGTMQLSALGSAANGTLYAYDRGDWRTLATGFRTINGLAFAPDDRTLYFSDSHPDIQTIWACDYDLDSGEIGERRIFRAMHDLDGRPDGAAVDAAGNYWIAGVGGGVIQGFAPDSAHLRTIAVPVENPTRVAFAGTAFATMVTTSMNLRLTRPDPHGLAGATLAIDAGVTGRAPHRAVVEA